MMGAPKLRNLWLSQFVLPGGIADVFLRAHQMAVPILVTRHLGDVVVVVERDGVDIESGIACAPRKREIRTFFQILSIFAS